MKALSIIDKVVLSQDQILDLLKIYEEKGRDFYYARLFEKDEAAFNQNALQEDNYYLGQLFNIDFTDAKLKLWSKKNYAPKIKEDIYYNNIKKAIKSIRTHGNNFDLFPNEVVDLAKMLAKNVKSNPILKKEKSDDIFAGMTKVYTKQEDLIELVDLFNQQIKNNRYETLVLLISFYVDFINLKIYQHDNELIGLILLFTLIQKHFSVYKYISFFKHLKPLYQDFEQGLKEANYYWDQGYPRIEMLHKTLIKVIKNSYEELRLLAHRYEFDRELNKTNNVEGTILKGKEIFSKADLRKEHPNISDSTIQRTLDRLKAEGQIRSLGTGRSAKWQRIKPKNSVEVLELFSDSDF